MVISVLHRSLSLRPFNSFSIFLYPSSTLPLATSFSCFSSFHLLTLFHLTYKQALFIMDFHFCHFYICFDETCPSDYFFSQSFSILQKLTFVSKVKFYFLSGSTQCCPDLNSLPPRLEKTSLPLTLHRVLVNYNFFLTILLCTSL